MQKWVYIFLGAGVAAALALPFVYLDHLHNHLAAQVDAVRQADQQFARTSPGHARLLARYNALERDRAAGRAFSVWEPNACEREALGVLFDAQESAAHAVPRPRLLRTDEPIVPPVLSGAILSPTCQVALNPGPALPPLSVPALRPRSAGTPPPLTPTKKAGYSDSLVDFSKI